MLSILSGRRSENAIRRAPTGNGTSASVETSSRTYPWTALLVVAVVVAPILVLSTACGPQGVRTGRGSGSPAEVSEDLDGLEVALPGSMAGYSRERFPHWSDAEEFGWDAPTP